MQEKGKIVGKEKKHPLFKKMVELEFVLLCKRGGFFETYTVNAS